MLARTPLPRCLECGLAYGEERFAYHHGDMAYGPAYWSDRGLLCSPACAGAHFAMRRAEGSMPTGPVDCPVDLFSL